MSIDTTQSTHCVLMIRPGHFGSNADTKSSNAFQREPLGTAVDVQRAALLEFDAMVAQLRAEGVETVVIEDTASPAKPDAIFPNNWFSTHASGDVYLYPLEARSRRPERRPDIIGLLGSDYDFVVREIIDLSDAEVSGRYLEGTGSLVLDRTNKIAYVALSSRTHPTLVEDFCQRSGFTSLVFNAADLQRRPIYHTNVLMSVGRHFAVVALEAIADRQQRRAVAAQLQATGHEIVEITQAQLTAFAANVLEVQSARGDQLIIMSAAAQRALTQAQLSVMQTMGKIVAIDIATIERIGGGGVRCMLAEIFLPRTPHRATGQTLNMGPALNRSA